LTERIILEFLFIIASLITAVIYLAKRSARQFDEQFTTFKNNHLGQLENRIEKLESTFADKISDFGEKIGRFDERMKSAEADIGSLFKRLNDHINNKS
jgi:phage host-nuclease inhibitor protein Gam